MREKWSRLAQLSAPVEEDLVVAPGSVASMLEQVTLLALQDLRKCHPELLATPAQEKSTLCIMAAMRQAWLHLLRNADTSAFIAYMLESQLSLPLDQISALVRNLPRPLVHTALGAPTGLKGGVVALLAIELLRRDGNGGGDERLREIARDVKDYTLFRMPDGSLHCTVITYSGEPGTEFAVSDTFDVDADAPPPDPLMKGPPVVLVDEPPEGQELDMTGGEDEPQIVRGRVEDAHEQGLARGVRGL